MGFLRYRMDIWRWILFSVLYGTVHQQNIITGVFPRGNTMSSGGTKSQASSNPTRSPDHLGQFLEKHIKPVIKWNANEFVLQVDPRYSFEPDVLFAPPPTLGEPWPLPRFYNVSKDNLQCIYETFKIIAIGNSCDILEKAMDKYLMYILRYSSEESYNALDNMIDGSRTTHTPNSHNVISCGFHLDHLDVSVYGNCGGYPNENSVEAYKIYINDGKAKLSAPEVWGALRGLETFSQLVFKQADGKLYIRETYIKDYPRFLHRGVLIDTARHYIFKEVLFEVLESMAQNKLNVLHWHIVDDNSFPYQSEVFPKLSQKGAFHPTLVYTQKDIAEIIEYARLRGIRVIPEFDSPGHTFSWGLGYPEIKTKCYENGKALFGPLGPLDPSKNTTYEFLRSLFKEIFNVFPDNYVHLGGDEVHTFCWWTNPELRTTLRSVAGISSGVQPNDYVQSVIGYYFDRLTKDLKEIGRSQLTGRSFIMWEDVVKSTNAIPRDSILQVWMNRQNYVQQLNEQGYRTIFSSCWYLDHSKYGIQWSEYYLCDPSPYFDDGAEKDKLLGGETCLWSEYVDNENLMTMLWPRASAVAERLWSSRTVRDLNSAGRRLQEHKCRMIKRGLNVGYASGPDYCLRTFEATKWHKEDTGYTSDSSSEEIIIRNIKSIGGKATLRIVSNTVILPFMNTIIVVAGLLVLYKIFRLWRRKWSFLPRMQKV